MNELQLPNDTKLAGKLIEGHVRKEQALVDRGLIGRLFGNAHNVPANTAAVIAVFTAVLLALSIIYWAGSTDFSRKDGAAALSSLVTLVLGYLFGRSSASKQSD